MTLKRLLQKVVLPLYGETGAQSAISIDMVKIAAAMPSCESQNL